MNIELSKSETENLKNRLREYYSFRSYIKETMLNEDIDTCRNELIEELALIDLATNIKIKNNPNDTITIKIIIPGSIHTKVLPGFMIDSIKVEVVKILITEYVIEEYKQNLRKTMQEETKKQAIYKKINDDIYQLLTCLGNPNVKKFEEEVKAEEIDPTLLVENIRIYNTLVKEYHQRISDKCKNNVVLEMIGDVTEFELPKGDKLYISFVYMNKTIVVTSDTGHKELYPIWFSSNDTEVVATNTIEYINDFINSQVQKYSKVAKLDNIDRIKKTFENVNEMSSLYTIDSEYTN